MQTPRTDHTNPDTKGKTRPAHRRNRALPLTITLGSILVVFTLVLTTLWNMVIIYNTMQLKQAIGNHIWNQWVILGLGSFLFVVIIVGITLFIIFMSRQIIINQMQKNFIDSVTHELRTPITSLKLYVETLQRYQLEGTKREQFLQTMLQDVDYLDQLVGHLLDAAKVEYRSRHDSQNIDLDTVILNSIEIIQRRYQLENSCFTYLAHSHPIQSDPVALQLVLVNLLDNAVKYSPRPPHIDLTVTVKEEQYLLQIQDQGFGIPVQEQKHIFSRFYRGSELGSAKGNGLGLFIVQETVRQLKGQIQVKSNGRHQGSTFSIFLPRT